MEIYKGTALILFFSFCGLIGFRTFKLSKQGINISAPVSNPIQRVRGLLPGLFFVAFIFEMLAQAFNFNNHLFPKALSAELSNSPILNLSGLILMTLAIYLMHLTLKSFKESLRFGLHHENIGKLVTNGIFARSRNPFFISIEMLFTGLAGVISTPFYIATAVLSIISIHFFIIREEKFMRQKYGHKYLNYCKKVRRYF